MYIKGVIRDCSLRYYVVMSNVLKHVNYLNAVLKSPKAQGLTKVPCLMHIM